MTKEQVKNKLLRIVTSRKFIVFATTTVLVSAGVIGGEIFLGVALAYIGAEGAIDYRTAKVEP